MITKKTKYLATALSLSFMLGAMASPAKAQDFCSSDILRGNQPKIEQFENNSQIKEARKTYNEALKNADKAYRASQKTAQDKLRDAIKNNNDWQKRLDAYKTYLTEMLSARRTRFNAKESAMQAYINAISATPVNHAPVANAQTITVSKNTSKAITLTATDADNNTLSYHVVSNPGHGTLSGLVPNLTYLPATDYTGTDSFTFKANDGTADSATVTISITVQ